MASAQSSPLNLNLILKPHENAQAEIRHDTIFKAAYGCQTAFHNISVADREDLDVVNRLPQLFNQSSRLVNKQTITLADLRDDYEQYRVWARNLGVFAAEQASLDFRLRDTHEIRDGFVSLLESLAFELINCLSLLKADQPFPQKDDHNSSTDSPSDSDESLKSDAVASSATKRTAYELQIRFRHIGDIINKLIRLAEAIRSSSSKSHATRAATFQLIRNGVNLTEEFEMRYLPLLMKHRFNLEEPLLSRFIKAISLRRRQFQYQTEHQRKLAYGGEIPKEQFTQSAEPLRKPVFITPVALETLLHHDQMVPDTRSMISTPTKATTLPNLPLKRKAPSRIVSASSRSSFNVVDIPPPPLINDRATHFQCPYCSVLLPRHKSIPKQWRNHVIGDLQPFLCLEPDCPTPNIILESQEAWLEHQKWEHSLEWWCEGNGPSHTATKFLTADSYVQHLRGEHSCCASQLTDKLIAAAGRPSLTVFSGCPLCSFQTPYAEEECLADDPDAWTLTSQRQRALQKHIMDDMLNIFLVALPERDDLLDSCSDTDAPSVEKTSRQALSNLSLDLESWSPLQSETPTPHYFCKLQACSGNTVGFGTESDLAQHMRNVHSEAILPQTVLELQTESRGKTPIIDGDPDLVEVQSIQEASTAQHGPICDVDTCDTIWKYVWASPELQNSVRKTYGGFKEDMLLQNFAAIAGTQVDKTLRVTTNQMSMSYKEKRQWYLTSLEFPGMDDGYLRISAPCPDTCAWFPKQFVSTAWDSVFKGEKRLVKLQGSRTTGKSTLIKYAVEHLRDELPQATVISYFFHPKVRGRGGTMGGMYQSLLLQLLQRFPDLQTCLDEYRSSNETLKAQTWHVNSLQYLFSWVISHLGDRHVVCFVDGLDYCKDFESFDASSFELAFMNAALPAGNNYWLCISQRHSIRADREEKSEILLDSHSNHLEDITKYMAHELWKDPISSFAFPRIAECCNGDFLWAILFVLAYRQALAITPGGNPEDMLYQTMKNTPGGPKSLFEGYLRQGPLEPSTTELARVMLSHGVIPLNDFNTRDKTPLLQAIEMRSQELVALLIDQDGIDVNLPGPDGMLPLHVAISNSDLPIIRLLLGHRHITVNSVNSSGETALMSAAMRSKSQIVRVILDHKDISVNLQDQRGMTALMLALLFNDTITSSNTVELLLERDDIDVNLASQHGHTALLLVAGLSHPKPRTVDVLLKHANIDVNRIDNDGLTALSCACLRGNQIVVKALLSHKNVDVNFQNDIGLTALMFAVATRKISIVDLLLADTRTDINTQDRKGRTVLSRAVEASFHYLHVRDPVRLDVLALLTRLLSHQDLNVNIADHSGMTALMRSARGSPLGVLECLLERADIDVNRCDASDCNALAFAALADSPEKVLAVLGHKNLVVERNSKSTGIVREWAKDHRHWDILEALRVKTEQHV